MAIRKQHAADTTGAADDAASGPEEPRVIDGRFELRDVVGTGGMATVYLAWDRRRNRPCAIKVLAENLAHDQEFRRRFRQEAEAASALVHPRIVGVYANGDADSTLYIAMEYVSGGTLRDLLRRLGRLPEGFALRLAAEVAEALAYAHGRRVVHRDIKPHNILLTPDYHVKVADFGIARTLDHASHTRVVLGSTQYISPEQARGGPAGPESDQYSLGVVLYEALGGRLPFDEAESPVAMALKHVNDPPFDLQWLRPDLSEATVTLVRRLLAKSPEERFAGAAAVAAELRRIHAGFESDETPTAVLPVPSRGAAPSLARDATVRLAGPAPRPAAASHTTRMPVLSGRRRSAAVPRAALAFVGLVGLWFIALGAYQAYRAGMFALPAQHARTAGSAVTVHAPLLLGKTVSDAQRIAASQHLSVAVASGRQDPQTAAGLIVAQDPSANAGIAAGGTIHVVVSEGSGMVPSLRGLAVAAAQQALASAGLRSGATRYTHDDTVAAGMIVDQSPAASAHVPAGAAVDLVISQGPATASPSADSAIVPTVTGMPLSQAESQLRAAGLRAGQVSYAYDDKAAAGIVIQQQKTAGTHASANDAVDMVVSRGRQPEPAQTPPSQPAPPTKPPSPPAPNPPPQTPPAPPAPNPPSQQFPAPPQPPPSDQPPAPPQNAPPDNPPTQTTP